MLRRAALLVVILAALVAQPAAAATPTYPTGVEASTVAACQSYTPTIPESPGGGDKSFTQEAIESQVTLIKVPAGGDKTLEGKSGFSRVGGFGEDAPCVESDDFQINDPGTYRVVTKETVLQWKSVIISPNGYCGEHQAEDGCSGWVQTSSTPKTTMSTFRVTGLPKRFDKKTKDLFNQISTRRNFQSSAYGAAAAITCPFLGPAAVGCGVLGGVMALGALAESYYYAELAKDPVDWSFRRVAAAKPVLGPHVEPQAGISQAAADALNALSMNAAAKTSEGVAMLTALDRAQGAHLSHKSADERKQLKAARASAGKIAALLGKEPALRQALASALPAGGFADQTIGKIDIANYRTSLFETVPQETAQGLATLGLPASRIGAIAIDQRTRSIAHQPATLSLVGSLNDPQTLADITASAAKLRAFSRGH